MNKLEAIEFAFEGMLTDINNGKDYVDAEYAAARMAAWITKGKDLHSKWSFATASTKLREVYNR
jgi:hypothetical protein